MAAESKEARVDATNGEQLPGLHHVTAIAGEPQRNVNFYTGVLGLRLVKQTVNFDDPSTYHLYYGDREGTPGTILTFFCWPGSERGRLGGGQFAAIGLAIPATSLGFWMERLVARGVPHELPVRRFGAPVVTLKDPDGLALELVATQDAGAPSNWTTSGIPAEHTIRRVQHVSLWERDAEQTQAFLTERLGFGTAGDEEVRRRYTTGHPRAAQIELVRASGFWTGVVGVGSIHHVAWRIPDNRTVEAWRETLLARGISATPIRDRLYFRSIYFNEPGGALFECATDEPGFAVDEPVDRLGTRLMLPPWFEPDRDWFERDLPPLVVPVGANGQAGSGLAAQLSAEAAGGDAE
jgi:catechol 2,3-dioxygenase-like lactoylglutathione lyase family enzyme